MNDLAEKALEGVTVVRRRVHDHPVWALGPTGFVVGVLVVVSGGRATAARPDRPLTSWAGLQDVRSSAIGSAAGSIMLAGVLTLAVLWVATLWLVVTRGLPLSRVWVLAAAWAIPFVLGPPLMDTSVYTYVAYGRLLRAGRNPYRDGPTALGDSPIVSAIDPARRGTASSSGPVGALLQHLAASVGNGGLLATVLVWRVVSVAAALWIARSVAELAARAELAGQPAPSDAAAVAACAMNPLVLLYVVSSPHLDAVMVALVLAAAVAAGQRRWWRALILATLAGGICPVGLVAVPLIAATHWFGRRRTRLWPVITRDSVIVAVVLVLPFLAVDRGWGWLRNVRSEFSSERTPYSLAGAVENGLALVVRIAPDDDLAAGGRLTAALAAACVLAYLLATLRQRPLTLSIGYALLWFGLLAPILQPWYLLWGTLALLPFATGQSRIVLVGLSVAGCVLAPQGFVDGPADIVTGACLAVVVLATGVALWLERPEPAAGQRPLEIPRTAGRTSAR